MKIKPQQPGKSRFNTGRDELKIIDFDRIKDEDLWSKVERFSRWGLTAADDKGHSTEFRFRMKPIFRDTLGQIQSLLSDGYYKTQAHFYRAIFGVGAIVLLHYLRKKKVPGTDPIMAVCDTMNIIAKRQRVNDIEEDIKKLKRELYEEEIEDDEYVKCKINELSNQLKELRKKPW